MTVKVIFGRYNPPVPFTATDKEKREAPITETTRIYMKDYPGGYEMVRARIEWSGGALEADDVLYCDWINMDTGENLGAWAYNLFKGVHSFWYWECIGHDEDEINGPGTWRVEFWTKNELFTKKTVIFHIGHRIGISSDPGNANIEIDGIDNGTSPDTGYIVNYLNEGEHIFLLKKTGYVDKDETIDVTDDDLLDFELEEVPEPETFTVSISSDQDPAAVTFDGADLTTPATIPDVPEGDHTFLLHKEGFTWQESAEEMTVYIDQDHDWMWHLVPEVPEPEPPPPPPNDIKDTWLDPEWWKDNFDIDIGEMPELTKTPGVNKYTDQDGNEYIEYEEELLLTDPPFWGLGTTKYRDANGVGYVPDKKGMMHPIAEANPLGFLTRATTRFASWLKNGRTLNKKAFKFNKTTRKFEVVSTAAAGAYILGTLTGTAKSIFQTTMLIMGFATITEWGIEETIGTASLGCYAARDLDAETLENANGVFEQIINGGEELHKLSGIVPGLSPVITMFIQANKSNLALYQTMAARKKGAESPFINWILAGNRTTVSVEVERVIDGDTIDIKKTLAGVTYDARVRLLGIDTPEKFTAAGEKSLNYIRSLLEGSTITLKLDPGRIYGKYRRILAVVYAAGKCVQLDLLEKGYARVMLKGDNIALDEIMPEDLPPGPHAHGILYYADKDFGWTAKLATFNLHGVEADAEVDVKELPMKKVDVAHGGTYKICVGDEMKIARVKDRKTKDVTI